MNHDSANLDGDTVYGLRHANRMTQRTVSEKTGIPQSRLSAIEHGLRITPKEAKKLLRVLLKG